MQLTQTCQILSTDARRAHTWQSTNTMKTQTWLSTDTVRTRWLSMASVKTHVTVHWQHVDTYLTVQDTGRTQTRLATDAVRTQTWLSTDLTVHWRHADTNPPAQVQLQSIRVQIRQFALTRKSTAFKSLLKWSKGMVFASGLWWSQSRK